jgi:hypothetical protein
VSDLDTMAAWHLAGAHVCSCRWPTPWPAGVFDVEECTTCGRLIIAIDAAAELVERLVRSGAVVAL